MTHYQRPGLTKLAQPDAAPARCIFQASNGDGYVVVGPQVYYVDPSWGLHSVGTINNDFDTPVSMVDNGTTIVIAIGSPYAGNASGQVVFAANPSAGNTITLNGVVFTFIAGASSGTNVHIGGTVGLTMANLLTQVNASVNPAITVAYYNWVTDGAGADFQVTYKTPGALGTLYTLAASVAVPSAAHLEFGTTFAWPGYTLALGDLSPSAVTQVNDTAFFGADRVDYLDTFIIFNKPGTQDFQSTLSNSTFPLDSTYIAAKTGWADSLQTLIVNREQIVLLGSLKSEMWYDAGGASFPFARLPGTHIEHGICAKYSVASADLNIYWLSRDLQGNGMVLRLRGYETKRISNYALEWQIAQMSDITDAVGFTYLQDGHLFYVLSFPTGNQTWVWDESLEDPEQGWHQRAWVDGQGGVNRDRGVMGANLYGKNVVLDWQYGTLYEQDTAAYVDQVNGVDCPITYTRTFPHLMAGFDPNARQYVPSNGHMVQHERFAIDAECGNAPGGVEPKFMLRWSDDRGKSWGNPIPLAAGKQGEYGTRPDERALGQAMDRVYELSWTFAGQVALNGAWVEGKVLNQ